MDRPLYLLLYSLLVFTICIPIGPNRFDRVNVDDFELRDTFLVIILGRFF